MDAYARVSMIIRRRRSRRRYPAKRSIQYPKGLPTRSSWQPRLTFQRLDAEHPVLSALKQRPPGSVSRQAWFRCVVIGCAGRLKERLTWGLVPARAAGCSELAGQFAVDC
jgi:hypothetical protein